MKVNLSNLKDNLNNSKGFLVLDGPNGAGKSTLQKKISDYLTEKGISSKKTREPGGTETGQKIREILLGQSKVKLEPLSEIYLFCADRTEHIHKVIVKALNNNEKVICDRYYYSTIAFQVYGRGLDANKTTKLIEEVVENHKPDLALILDIDPKAGLKRTKERGDSEEDSFEQEELKFHKDLRVGFLELADKCNEPCYVLDANQNEDDLWEQTKPVIDIWLNSCQKK